MSNEIITALNNALDAIDAIAKERKQHEDEVIRC